MSKATTFVKKTTTTSTSIIPVIDATTIMVNGDTLAKQINDLIIENTTEDSVLARCVLTDETNTLTGINTFTGQTTFTGNTTLGDTSTDTVTVNALSTFNTNLSVKDTMICKNDATGIGVQFKCQPYVTSVNDTTIASSDYALTTKKYVDTNCAKILTDANTVSGGKNFTGGITVRYMMSANDTGVNFTTLPRIDTAYVTTATSATNCIATKGYCDAGDATTLTSANTFATTGDATTLTSAKSYTDTSLVTGKAYTDTSLVTGKAYTDTSLVTAKAYTDTNLVTGKAYTDTSLVTGKAYTDTSLVTGKAYTDTSLTTAKAYTDTSLTTAKAYTDTSLTTAKAYTDTSLVTGKTYTDTSLVTGKAYTDTSLTTANAYTDTSLTTANAYTDNKVIMNNGSAVYSQTTTTTSGYTPIQPAMSNPNLQTTYYLQAPYLGTQTAYNVINGQTPISAFTVSFYCNFLTNSPNSNPFTPKTALLDFRHYYTCMNAYTASGTTNSNTSNNTISSLSPFSNSNLSISTASTAGITTSAGVFVNANTTFGSNCIEGHIVVTLFKGALTKKLIYAPTSFLDGNGTKKVFQASYGTSRMSFYPFECTYVSDTSFRIDVQFPNQVNNPQVANWISSCGFSCEVKCSKLKNDNNQDANNTLSGINSVGSMGDAVLSLTTG